MYQQDLLLATAVRLRKPLSLERVNVACMAAGAHYEHLEGMYNVAFEASATNEQQFSTRYT